MLGVRVPSGVPVKNSLHRAISGPAENCAMQGISSPPSAARCAGPADGETPPPAAKDHRAGRNPRPIGRDSPKRQRTGREHYGGPYSEHDGGEALPVNLLLRAAPHGGQCVSAALHRGGHHGGGEIFGRVRAGGVGGGGLAELDDAGYYPGVHPGLRHPHGPGIRRGGA